jgi:hypothetical protein
VFTLEKMQMGRFFLDKVQIHSLPKDAFKNAPFALFPTKGSAH